MRIAMHTVGMLLFGGTCLFLMGLAFDARIASPLPVSTPPAAIATFGNGNAVRVERIAALNAALRGVSATLTAAADSLAFERDGGAPLLDAAWRVAQVIAFAGARSSDDELLVQIEATRRTLQNGDAAGAARRARLAARIADGLAPAAMPMAPATGATYGGAVVLDINGNRLGTIAMLDAARVVIERPSVRNVLGFITVNHGVRDSISRAAVLLGKPRRFGETLAVATAPAGGGIGS